MPPTTQHHSSANPIVDNDRFSKKASTIRSPDRPLELTTNIKPQHDNMSAHHLTKHTTENILKNATHSAEQNIKVSSDVIESNLQQSVANDLILPPPPPMWYPPLYPPPYGVIDPLHFFIDLRVSGHVYDRNKKEQEQKQHLSAYGNKMVTDSNFATTRHGSAFSVPLPRNNNSKGPVNLSNDKKIDNLYKKGDNTKCNTNYVLQNLPRIYNTIYEEHKDATISVDDDDDADSEADNDKKIDDINKDEDEEKRKSDKDLRALIGLELVVDYVKKKEDGKPAANDIEEIPD